MADRDSNPTAGGDPHHQLTVLVLAGAVWSWWPAPSFVALLAAYLVALLLLNSSFVLLGPVLTLNRLSRRGALVAFLLGISAPASILLRVSPQLFWFEDLSLLHEHLPDRLALERRGAVFPRIIRTDQPQRFYVHARGAETVSAHWPGLREPLRCVALGHGLFRFEYRPAVHGGVEDNGGQVELSLAIDRAEVTRQMPVVRPQPHPRWFASHPDSGRAATVSEETDQLVVVSRDGRHQVLEIGDGPSDCAWLDENLLAVAHRHSGELTLIDIDTQRRRQLQGWPGRWTRLDVSPDRELLAAARGGARPQVLLFSAESMRQLFSSSSGTGGVEVELQPTVVELPDEPDWVCFAGGSTQLVVSCRQTKTVHRIGRQKGEPFWSLDAPPLRFPRPITAMGRSQDGATICLATTSDRLGEEDLRGNHLVAHAIHLLDPAGWRIRGTRLTDRRSQRQDQPGSADRGGSPMGFCAVGDDRMLVAMAGTHEVWRMSLAGESPPVMLDLKSPGMSAPHGVGDLGDGRWCVSSPVDAAIEVRDAQGRIVRRVDLAAEPASDEERWRRRGETTFYETTRAGLSCQSCHLHGASDYARHNIGQGHLTATLSTSGVAFTAPYLRDASNSRLRDLHDLASDQYRGWRKDVPWDRARALDAYLRSLPAPAPTEIDDPQRMRRGLSALVKADCVRCHALPAFTNLGLHFTASLFPERAAELRAAVPRPHLLDTPSLLGLSQSAPYLHDGRAETLWQVLQDHNPSSRHGDVRALSRQELEDLLVFLGQL